MKKAFLIIILPCICAFALCGCGSIQRMADEEAANNRLAISTYNSQLEKIKIGMTETQVVNALGNPSGDNVTRTAAVKSEQWIYTGETIIQNAGVSLSQCGYSTVLTYQNAQVFLYFENGILTSTQGF